MSNPHFNETIWPLDLNFCLAAKIEIRGHQAPYFYETFLLLSQELKTFGLAKLKFLN